MMMPLSRMGMIVMLLAKINLSMMTMTKMKDKMMPLAGQPLEMI